MVITTPLIFIMKQYTDQLCVVVAVLTIERGQTFLCTVMSISDEPNKI